MKHFKLSLLLFFGLNLSAYAQTGSLNQAKIDYKNKEYAKALPVFEQELKAKPTDAYLNLWYGVCLVETNTDGAEEYLLVASKKNIPESYLYLGDLYAEQYRVTDARDLYDRYAKVKPRETESTLKSRYERIDDLGRFISRAQDVQIIDSLILDKSMFLEAYKLSPDAGTLTEFNSFFDKSGSTESVVYENGKESKIYFGQAIEKRYVTCSMDKLLNGYGTEKLLSENNFGLSGNTNYPFVLMDGVTLYFSGVDKNGIGDYDMYVTRYNLNNDTYLAPELMNMPFNSPYNDYMMVVDESKEIGWFATDRFQAEGKVCVYTFIPDDEVVLIETDDELYRERRARLTSIKDTWKSGVNYSDLIKKAREKIQKTIEKHVDFTFVIDDNHTYYTLTDFLSQSARKMFSDLVGKRKALSALEYDLETKREAYGRTSNSERNSLTDQIIGVENKLPKLHDEISVLEKMVRNEEIKVLK